MVVLYVHGKRMGEWSEAEEAFRELSSAATIEFRDENGNVLTTTNPLKEPLCPWDPTLTIEQIDRYVSEGGGVPLAEIWKELGVRRSTALFGFRARRMR